MQVKRIVDFEQQHANMLLQLPQQTQELIKMRQHEAASVAGEQKIRKDEALVLLDCKTCCYIFDFGCGCGMPRVIVNLNISVAYLYADGQQVLTRVLSCWFRL